MLFNSFIFVFAFLPLSLAVTYALGRWKQDAAKIGLLLLSLGFYAWWRPAQLPLLLGSIAFNYTIGELMLRAHAASKPGRVKALLAIGICADLLFLGYFKYANFFVDNVNWVVGSHIHLKHIALPLAISFFTFQKIAYLIDTANGETRRLSPLNFSLFAAFYPQLIAGPIVHFKEIIPQLERKLFGRLIARNLMVGLMMFAIGLFKKTVIADTIAGYINPVFAAASKGHELSLASAWVIAVGYTLQLYFDFSGYSDMAIGLGRMLGVKLPLNFHSPLRSASIIDYWRRWHMTLQRFIVSYIFNPLSLSLNRLSAEWEMEGWAAFLVGAALPVFITFLAVGTWHGAGWTFVFFGAMHGIYLSLNQAWREYHDRRRRRLRRAGKPAAAAGPNTGWRAAPYHLLTLVSVMYANVMFRADTAGTATWIWRSMTGLGSQNLAPADGFNWGLALSLTLAGALVFLAPNSQQIMGRFDPAYNWREWRAVGHAPLAWTWKPNAAGLLFAGGILFMGLMFIQRGRAVFLYFNF